jgi:Tol biopolymer transport system component
VYALSPDAKWAVSTDFSRLADTRPGYGYAGVPDRYADVLAPEQTGIWRMDLTTGQQRLILSYAEVARVPYKIGDWTGSKHKINHLLVSPDGRRFIFLHRRRGGSNPEAGATRMFTASPEGRDLHVLDPYGKTSHFIWRRSTHVMAWAYHPSHSDRFYVYEDRTANVEVFGKEVMTVNGHNTYLPGTDWRWILNDTYPDGSRLQHPYLYDTITAKRYPLGHFLSPEEYRGEWRCDTHPRSSPDGRFVCIDSPHGGNGRQMYLIDVSGITRRTESQ